MSSKEKYCGIIPAFYACYDDAGAVNPERTRALARHLLAKGVKGLYVSGSSGECIYQSVAERKLTLESVMAEVGGKITVIAHVACNNTADSRELAAHAEAQGVDAIAAIPPIYFHLPDHAIARYWNDISAAAPHTDFFIYNIPQLAGVALSLPLFKEMLKNPRVMGVKNSSMPVQDIQLFKDAADPDKVVFNGPDEQLAGGLAMGADGGIGGTYGVMPELYFAIEQSIKKGDTARAVRIQNLANRIIYAMCSCRGNLYAVLKAILKEREQVECGSVRSPLAPLADEDAEKIRSCAAMIDEALADCAE